jgi:hypothetical protein
VDAIELVLVCRALSKSIYDKTRLQTGVKGICLKTTFRPIRSPYQKYNLIVILFYYFMTKKGTKNKNYSPEFKISVILDMHEHHLSYRETERKYINKINLMIESDRQKISRQSQSGSAAMARFFYSIHLFLRGIYFAGCDLRVKSIFCLLDCVKSRVPNRYF